MPLPINTGAAPVIVLDDDALTAKAIEKQTEAIKENTAMLKQLVDIQRKCYELELADSKKVEPPKPKEKKVVTIKHDSEGYISGAVVVED